MNKNFLLLFTLPFFIACGGENTATTTETDSTATTATTDSTAEEPETTAEPEGIDFTARYSEYNVPGFKLLSEPQKSETQVNALFVPEDESKAVLKSVAIAATKINDGAYLESEEAYKEYYKSKIDADKATVITKEINKKQVFFMQYEADGGAGGKAIQVNFLGGGNFAVEMRIFEVKKGSQPNFDAMMEAVMPFVEQATQK